MRRPLFDPPAPAARLTGLLASALVGCLLPADARAQTAAAPTTASAPASAASPAGEPAARPAAAYVAREKLMMYVELDGLDAHEESWRKTAAYRMLNETPLGGMLEEVGVALFERLSTWLPNRKINGADGVAIVKHIARHGAALAYHADPSAPKGQRGVLVFRGVSSKEAKSQFSRLVISFMDPASKHKLVSKGAAQVVVVPPPQADEKATDQGWAWWAAGGDLGVALMQPSDADAVLAVLDGKSPSLVGFEPVEALKKPEGGLDPVFTAYLDTSVRTEGDPGPTPLDAGVQRIEYRWGFQDDALASVTRIVAPKPRSGALSFLDEPSFEAKKLLPIPDGVEYFASASLRREQWASMIAGAIGQGEGKRRYDALVESVRTRSRMDFEKDLLGNLGPRVVAYMAPSTSVATVEDAPAGGVADPVALLSSLGPRMPRPVLVAEVGDEARFSRALDAVMLEVNKQIKAVAAEQIAEAVKADAANPAGAPGGRGDEGADRKDRRRDEPATPEFRMVPSSGGETARIYMFNVPTSSPIQGLPAGFKPTVRLEGGFIAISTSPEAARLAVESLRRKPWTPAEAVAQAVSRTPDDSVLLLYGDFREATSAVLASLPGTLQTGINTAIAASERLMNPTDPAASQARGPGGMPGVLSATGSSSSRDSSYGSMRGQSPASGPGISPASAMMAPGSGGTPGQPGAPGAPGAPRAGGDASMIQIRVDPAKLPKSDELRALMFPSTTSVAVDDQAIRIETRGAFPDVTALLGAKGVLPAMLAPAIAAARNAAKNAAKPADAAGQPQPGGQPGAMQPGLSPGLPGAPGAPGAPRAPGAPGASPPGGSPGGRSGRDR